MNPTSHTCTHKTNQRVEAHNVYPLEYRTSVETLVHQTGQICCRWNNLRRVWRYQRGHQNPYIEEEQTTQWPKEKVQKDKQRSTKHIYKTKCRTTRTQLKLGMNSGAPEGWAIPAPLVTLGALV